MKKISRERSWQMWLPFGIVTLLLGCGEIGGSGQCSGVDVTGMCVTIDSIQPTDTVTGFGDTSDVDAKLTTPDCNGDGTLDDAEPFGKHSAKVTITATLMQDVTSPPAPAFVTWTSYIIEYIPNPNNNSSAPGLGGWNFPIGEKVNADSSKEITVELVPIDTKSEYETLGGSLNPPTAYTAVYTFRGTSQFNQDITLKSSTNFNMGDFDGCS